MVLCLAFFPDVCKKHHVHVVDVFIVIGIEIRLL